MLRISRCVMICLYNANIMCVAMMRSSDVFRGAREEEGAVCGGEGSGAEAYPVTCVPSLFFPFHLFFGSSFPSLHLFPSFLVLILSSFNWAVCLLCLLYLRACQHTACPACLPACPACLLCLSAYRSVLLADQHVLLDHVLLAATARHRCSRADCPYDPVRGHGVYDGSDRRDYGR